MPLEKSLARPLLPSGGEDESRGADTVDRRFETFGVRRYSVLVDHSTRPLDLPRLADRELVALYTFDVNRAGKTLGPSGAFAGQEIRLLTLDGPLPGCDGWLVASTSRAAVVGLNHALLRCGAEQQVLVRLYGSQATEISATVDVLSGESDTLVTVNHYFDRKYGIRFPLDVRFTVCACDGSVRAAGQRVIPPGGLTVVDCRQLRLGDFEGFMRVEMEVENLQVRVQPFLHFWADYVSPAGLCRNHQSGWKQWEAGSVFSRGYMPVDRDEELTLSFYNEGAQPVHPTILLHYTEAGEEKTVERASEPIPPRQMSFQSVSRLFSDVSLQGVPSAFYLVRCDRAIHRPNYYIGPRGLRQFTNTSHQTGSDACHWALPTDCWTREQLDLLDRHGADPWVIQLPILPRALRIDTYLGLLSSTICAVNEFTFILRNERGEVVLTRDERLDGTTPQFTNLNEYAARHGVDVDHGLFGVAPRRGLARVPRRAISLLGFRHRDYPHLCTAPASGMEDPNLPFYVDAQVPPSQQYDFCSVQTTDRFGPGFVSDDFDTLYVVTNCSLHRSYDRTCRYRLEILDATGRATVVHREIPPQCYDLFWLSEVLRDTGVRSGGPLGSHYTVWQRSDDTLLISYHFLVRKSDHAMSADDTFGGTLLIEPQVCDGPGTAGTAGTAGTVGPPGPGVIPSSVRR